VNEVEFKQFVKTSIESNTPLDFAVTNDPRCESVIAEIQRGSVSVAEEVQQPATDGQLPATVAGNSPEVISDDEIIKFAASLVEEKNLRAEIKAAILKEFYEPGAETDQAIEQEVDGLIDRAYEKAVDIAQKEKEEVNQILGQVANERNRAQEEADTLLVEKYKNPSLFNNSPIDPNDKERAAQVIRRLEKQAEEEAEKEENFDDETGEPFPECPVFTGPLTELAKSLYPSLPLEFKQMGLIVRWGLMRSGIDKLQWEPHLQPRFDVIMVSLPNRGKTAANNETRKAVDDIVKMAKTETAKRNNFKPTSRVFGDFVTLASADSGPFLVGKFYELVRDAEKQVAAGITTDDTGKIMFDPDEISDVFEKARSSNGRISTLFTEFLKLHSGNRTGNGTKQTGDKPVDKAHLAIFGGTTVEKYKTLWTGTGAGGDGLMSRFIPMTTNAPQVPPVPLPTDTTGMVRAYERLAKLVLMPGQEIVFDSEAVRIMTEWWQSIDTSKKNTTRVLEMVKQLLIVLAVTNAPENHDGTTLTVGPDLMRQAIKFGEYVIAARERLNPADSWSHIQAMENTIIEWMRKHGARKNPRSRNDVRRGVHPQRMPGGLGAFKIGWDNCVTTGVLKVREKTQRDSRYSL
jgi:Protein of unknown function (DUF3987)